MWERRQVAEQVTDDHKSQGKPWPLEKKKSGARILQDAVEGPAAAASGGKKRNQSDIKN